MKFFRCALLIKLALLFCPAFSQNEFKGPIVYAEIGGAGGPHISVNLEHLIFTKSKWYLNARLGYGLSNIQGQLLRSFPIGFNIFHGMGKSHFEIALTLAYSEGRQYIVDGDAYSKALYLVPGFSYRFQKPNGGFFLRAGYTPLLKLQEYTEAFHEIRTNHSFGLALGYFFYRAKVINNYP